MKLKITAAFIALGLLAVGAINTHNNKKASKPVAVTAACCEFPPCPPVCSQK